MFKAGTVADILTLKDKIPEEVYREAVEIVTMLDESFEEDRDVDFEDGGFVMIMENKQDLDDFTKQYVEFESSLLEYVQSLPCSKEPYLNAFYLYNEYEFGITLLIPMSIAPQILISKLKSEEQKKQATSDLKPTGA